MPTTAVHAWPDRAKPIDEGLWTVDAAPIHPLGFPLPLRMTVVRLATGDLMLYSPTQHSPALQRELETLGGIRHLVASNIAHWMFVRDWQLACPDAVTWGVPGLSRRAQVREQGLRVDAELGPVAPEAWRNELDQAMVTSGPFVEVDLFHRASGTLLVTDLVLNVDGTDLPHLPHTAAEISGILAPNGKAPLHLRLLLKLNGRAVGRAGQRLIAFAPKRVVMCHGHPHEAEATDRLREALDWFVGRDGPKTALGPIGAGAIGAGLLLGLGFAVAEQRHRRMRR